MSERVAREKERASLRSGDRPAKAARYAQEVRDGDAARAAAAAKAARAAAARKGKS